jgi:RNA polymerase sigma-70 factor (ECF subfamily)
MVRRTRGPRRHIRGDVVAAKANGWPPPTLSLDIDHSGPNGEDDGSGREMLGRVQAYLEHRRTHFASDLASEEAWELFYRTYDPIIREVVWRFRRRRPDHDDCVQDVWRVIILRLPRFRHEPSRGRFRAWIKVVAGRAMIDLERRQSGRLEQAAPGFEDIPDRDGDPALIYERGLTQSAVRQALDEFKAQISESGYQILHLRWIEGREPAEIAEILSLTPPRVWARHHRALRRFRELFRHSFGESHSAGIGAVRAWDDENK